MNFRKPSNMPQGWINFGRACPKCNTYIPKYQRYCPGCNARIKMSNFMAK